ncbi:MAG: GNAT family N-acetyltransferase [Candidatus Heimdallarchaeota archaeon]|nr:GNAT family N-acetyltransferase [Candidatus Heimdallarchaeota archaeon]
MVLDIHNRIEEYSSIILEYEEILSKKYNEKFDLINLLINGVKKNGKVFGLSEKDGIAWCNLASGGLTIYVSNQLDENKRIDKEKILLLCLLELDFTAMKFELREPYSSSLQELAIGEFNFRKITRHSMKFSNKTELIYPSFEENEDLVYYDPTMDEVLAEIIADTHFTKENDDSYVMPMYSGIEGARRLIKNIVESQHGNFKPELSIVLRLNKKIIGVCFMTRFNKPDNSYGFIPEIVIQKEYTGKGYGRKLLIHALKNYFDKQNDEFIGLAVTNSNNAKYLYLSVGFEITETISQLIKPI